MSKVFLSYCHEDEAFVRELYRRLKQDGVGCFLDRESISGGDNWVLALQKALEKCDFFVPVLTPDYCSSVWAQKEFTVVMAKFFQSKDKTIIPLLLKECGDQVPLLLSDLQFIDVSSQKKFEANYPEICRKLGGHYRIEEEKEVDRTKLPPLCPLPPKHRMPYHTLGDRFAGRVKDLWTVDDGLGRCQTAVVQGVGMVVGMGGIGKTQLAVEYVHRFGCHFPGGVFWVDAEMGWLSMINTVAEAAGIEVDTKMAEQEQLNRLWHLLSKEPVLVVLDNFPEGEDMEAWLPPEKSIFTLVTSRRKDFYGGFCHDLDRLADEEALALLNSGQRSFNIEEAQPLIRGLEGLPLALELVKHFLNIRKGLSIKDLLEEMHALGQVKALKVFTEKCTHQLPTGHSKEVAATFRMGWDLASDFEKEVLKAISLLAPVPVPRRVLRKVLQVPSESKLQDPLDEAVSRLDTSLSMVELDEEEAPRMHRLIAAFVQTLINKDDALHQEVITAVRGEMARVTDDKDIKSFRELEKVLPHADFLLSSSHIAPEQAVDIANYMGWLYRKLGGYRLAEKYRRKSLNIAESSYKPGTPEIATPQSNLALVLKDLGQLEEARDLLRAALEADQKSFEPGHPSIAIRQSNLALVLQDLGQLEEARDLLRAALEAAKKSFEPGHPKIVISQSNLAAVLQDLGQLEEARDLLRAALESAKKSFEPGHPKIAIRQSNLALVLKDLGQLQEAKELANHAYHTFLEKFGPEHYYTKRVKGNLDSIVKAEIKEAEKLRS
jgi:tetratricopeptide (TPR) repeat protein